MAHFGLLGDFRFGDSSAHDDIRGAKVYGRHDEKLGTIDDVIFDHSNGDIRYVVVAAGSWFSSRKFLIPTHRVHTSADHKDAYSVNLDKDQVQNLPRYQELDLSTQARWESCERRYSDFWHAGPVQHRNGSDRTIAPTTEEMPSQPGSLGSQLSDQEQARLSSHIVPPLSNDVTIEHTAVGLGDRWSTFEERLRHHRREITKNCRICTVELASDQPSENAA